jgi:uncharacterized protein YjbI with pentapeptide repeats
MGNSGAAAAKTARAARMPDAAPAAHQCIDGTAGNKLLPEGETVTRIAFVLLLAFAALTPASCGFLGESDNAPPPAANPAILAFQTGSEALTLPRLLAGNTVYTNVILRLATDSSWSLASIGPQQPRPDGESIQAVLTMPDNAFIDMDWRPADATITISRLHVDAKVYGNVALRLTGDKWAWGSDMQELFALTLADFAANPSLVATAAHHVVLQSAPETATQSYPLRLDAKVYKFCMDAQDEGADTLRLVDAAGKEEFSLKAGDPCVDVNPAAGTYTMQHAYGGAGAKRMVFVHPAAAPAAAPTALAAARSIVPSALAASDPNYPEYWAVYEAGTGKYLTFTGINDYGGNLDPNSGYRTAFGCRGRIQAVADTGYFYWPDDPTTETRTLFGAASFFEITRASDGTPSGFGLPVYCSNWPPSDGSGLSLDPDHHTFAVDNPLAWGVNERLWVVPLAYDPDNPASSYVADNDNFHAETLTIQNFANNGFQLKESWFNWTLSVLGGADQSLGLNTFGSSANFRLGFRYFPNGLPPSMADGSGTWILAPGEVAMFSGSDCTGAAMISEGVSLPVPPQPTWPYSQAHLAVLDDLLVSLQLGPQAAVSVYTGNVYQGDRKIFNASGCLKFSDAGFPPGSIQLSTDTAGIVVQTNSCEYCNLAGVDLSRLDLSAGVRLQHANLTGTRFANSDLSGADLRFATLQGANLNDANLESANLCLASLNANKTGAAASLAGAHLKNANLYGANLDGADFTYASFYSDAPQSCQSSACDTYARPSCASAYLANMNSTRFPNAYLAGVDMGHVTANGAVFSGAILFGASFSGANLNRNAGTGAATDFSYAFLQGTDFTNAQVQYARFSNAYVDSDSSNTCMQTLLNNEYTGFPGLQVANSSGQCVAGVQQTPTCIQYVYNGALLPATDATNSCPDGSSGPCTAVWTKPVISQANASQKNATCQPAPLCDGFITPLNTCW